MKICRCCKINKSLSEFYFHSTSKDGYRCFCKSCMIYKQNRKSPKVVFKIIYRTQLTNSLKRGHTAPAYTFEQLCQWVDQQPNAVQIWDDWVNSNFNIDLKPSIDRLNPNLGYSLTNIRLVTWSENNEKGHQDITNGIQLVSHKSISAFNLDGSFYKNYFSSVEASKEIGVSSSFIRAAANGIKRTAGGFIWKFV